jgi:uncharacterized membrane protein YfcA
VTIETFAPALAIILGAYFIRGITGFGSGLIAVPLLALILPLQTVVPLVLVLDLCASLIMSHRARARYLFNSHGDKRVSRNWSVPAGLSGGLIGALFGTGGPPYVIYLTHRIKDKSRLRATLSGLFMLDGLFRVITFLIAGLLGTHLLPLLLASAPVVFLALSLGHRVHIGISDRQMLKLIGTLLLVSGGSLLVEVWS